MATEINEWEEFSALLRSNYDIILAGGQNMYMDKIFRIAHISYFGDFGVISLYLQGLRMYFELSVGISRGVWKLGLSNKFSIKRINRRNNLTTSI